MIALYHDAQSPVHRLPPGIKLGVVAIVATLAFAFPGWWMLAGIGSGVALLQAASRIPLKLVLAQIRPALWIFAAIFAIHAFLGDWLLGAFVVIRFVLILQLAALVTLTTRVSEIVEALERGLAPLRRIGIEPARIALAITLAIRFVPVMASEAAAIREAQRARGLQNSMIALAVPLIVRGLHTAESVAEALDARGFEAGGRAAGEGNRGSSKRREPDPPSH